MAVSGTMWDMLSGDKEVTPFKDFTLSNALFYKQPWFIA